MKNEILKIMDKNGRVTPQDLALMLDSDVETIQKEIQEMEQEHVICGYPTLINWDKTDCERVSALIEVKVTPQRGLGFDKIAERIYKFDEVESVYLISGEFDLAVMIEGKTMREVANFVSSKLSPLESVLSTSTNFILKKYKEHGLALTDESSEEERMLITP